MNGRALTPMSRSRRGQHGFSLTEVLVTMAMVGLLTAAMFSLYLNMQRTTYNQEDIVDTQQSLRVAMDLLARDIRMAGFIIPAGTTGVDAASTATSLVLNTASNSYAFARLDSDVPVPSPHAEPVIFTVAEAAMMDPFLEQMVSNPGTIRVRVIRPGDGSQPFDADLAVTKVAGATDRETDRAAGALRLSGITNVSLVNYKSGDLIALVADGAPDPATITWNLNAGNLQRITDAGTGAAATSIVAANVSAAQFAYLDDSGSALTTFPLSATDRENIAAVRVTLTAAAVNQMDQVDRTRSMTSVIRIKNR